MSCEILYHVISVVAKWEDLFIYLADGSDELVLSNYIASLLHEILQNLGFRNIKKISGFDTDRDLSLLQMQWIFLFVKRMSCGC
jgi:hypothetical protein